MSFARQYDVLVIGGGHAGAEAAWAAANLGARVAMVTMDPARIGQMSCNPAIGGLAKGQMVREIDALGGLMGLAADATGIQFRILNASKGPAVRGPRCQSDKYRYAREVRRLLATRQNLTILAGTVERFDVDPRGRVRGVWAKLDADANAPRQTGDCCGEFGPIDFAEKPVRLQAKAVVLTTGTFMRGLMHTGERKTDGGRVGEGSAVGICGALREMGFELGRLKTGTPPRLAAETIDFNALDAQPGDADPTPFSDMTQPSAHGRDDFSAPGCGDFSAPGRGDFSRHAECDVTTDPYAVVRTRFPVLDQRVCWITATNSATHDLIRANLHRAPMYNGQIAPGSAGPRYCPSIEDKVVRFADRTSHHVFLEPESLDTNEVYCNGISTSLPADVQERIVRNLPGCERATILRHGYAVEYDMVWPHQIDATAMTKLVEGLFLAGQINGTSGYEEAAGQGLIAGLNAVRFVRGGSLVRLGREQSYIGVMMDDLVTKTPREPYRMFTSRAEFRLLLRADNADERLTPLGREWGLVDDERWVAFEQRRDALRALRDHLTRNDYAGQRMIDYIKRPEVDGDWVVAQLNGFFRSPSLEGGGRGGCSIKSPSLEGGVRGGCKGAGDASALEPSQGASPDGGATTLTPNHSLKGEGVKRLAARLVADVQYAGYIDRQRREIARLRQQEDTPLPRELDYERITGLRREAGQTLNRFRPATLGQAGRLAGITPADLMVVSVAVGR